MPMKLKIKSGWACRNRESLNPYAHETKSQKQAGMQNREIIIPYARAN